MAVRRLQYGQELEKGLKKGGLEQAHKKTAERSQVRKTKKKKAGEALERKVARKLREIFYGGRTYAGKKFTPSGETKRYKVQKAKEIKQKKPTTTRTKAVVGQLKKAGLTTKEIAKLRGKK